MLEGGDVLVIGHGCVMVGMGERTRPAAVEELALGRDEQQLSLAGVHPADERVAPGVHA